MIEYPTPIYGWVKACIVPLHCWSGYLGPISISTCWLLSSSVPWIPYTHIVTFRRVFKLNDCAVCLSIYVTVDALSRRTVMCSLSTVSQFGILNCTSCSTPLLFEATALIDASTLGFSVCTVLGFGASECRTLLCFSEHPLTPHVLFDLHSVMEWSPTNHQKHNLSFLTLSYRSATANDLHLLQFHILWTPSLIGHSVLLFERIALKFDVEIFVVTLVLTGNLFSENCSDSSSCTKAKWFSQLLK